MRRCIYFLFPLLLSSCNDITNKGEAQNRQADEKVEKRENLHVNRQLDTKSCYETPAIGNLYLGVSKKEFEKQKRIFLQENPNLGNLAIKSIKGYLYDGKIERIIIISKNYKLLFLDDLYINYKFSDVPTIWRNMYEKKYTLSSEGCTRILEKDGMKYNIYDNLVLEVEPKSFNYDILETDFYNKIPETDRLRPFWTDYVKTEGKSQYINVHSKIDIYNSTLYKNEKDRIEREVKKHREEETKKNDGDYLNKYKELNIQLIVALAIPHFLANCI